VKLGVEGARHGWQPVSIAKVGDTVTFDATVNRILERVAPGLHIDRSVLNALAREKPRPEALVSLLAAADPATVRAAVLYVGIYGTGREAALLALCLHHADSGVARLAEHCLWSLWMQGGSDDGNRCLAQAVRGISAGKYVEAVETLDALLAHEPGFAEAHFQRGLALSSIERPREAAREYRHALRLNPHHFGAAAALGHALLEQGDLRGALRFYRKALRIHPRLEDLPDAVRELELVLSAQHGQHA
jgi:tetratricopeptide (TPR) repeat protein